MKQTKALTATSKKGDYARLTYKYLQEPVYDIR